MAKVLILELDDDTFLEKLQVLLNQGDNTAPTAGRTSPQATTPPGRTRGAAPAPAATTPPGRTRGAAPAPAPAPAPAAQAAPARGRGRPPKETAPAAPTRGRAAPPVAQAAPANSDMDAIYNECLQMLQDFRQGYGAEELTKLLADFQCSTEAAVNDLPDDELSALHETLAECLSALNQA
jgi:hypothetical protein